jgi:hypothetical protein
MTNKIYMPLRSQQRWENPSCLCSSLVYVDISLLHSTAFPFRIMPYFPPILERISLQHHTKLPSCFLPYFPLYLWAADHLSIQPCHIHLWIKFPALHCTALCRVVMWCVLLCCDVMWCDVMCCDVMWCVVSCSFEMNRLHRIMLHLFSLDPSQLHWIMLHRPSRHYTSISHITYLCRETCVGSSDDVVIPIEEFRSLIDGAVRIARSEVSTIFCSATSCISRSVQKINITYKDLQ